MTSTSLNRFKFTDDGGLVIFPGSALAIPKNFDPSGIVYPCLTIWSDDGKIHIDFGLYDEADDVGALLEAPDDEDSLELQSFVAKWTNYEQKSKSFSVDMSRSLGYVEHGNQELFLERVTIDFSRWLVQAMAKAFLVDVELFSAGAGDELRFGADFTLWSAKSGAELTKKVYMEDTSAERRDRFFGMYLEEA